MTHSTMQLPRTPLELPSSSAGSLAPKDLKDHDQQPNPNMDRSGIREAINSVGSPIGQSNVGTNFAGFILTFIGGSALLFSVAHAIFISVLFPGAEGTIGNTPIASLITGAAALVFVFIGIMLLRGRLGSTTRLRTAWANGWIEYRPALIGELTYRRRVNYNDTTDYYYKGPSSPPWTSTTTTDGM